MKKSIVVLLFILAIILISFSMWRYSESQTTYSGGVGGGGNMVQSGSVAPGNVPKMNAGGTAYVDSGVAPIPFGTMDDGYPLTYCATCGPNSGPAVNANVMPTEDIGAVFPPGTAVNTIVYRPISYGATVDEWTIVCSATDANAVAVDVLRLTFTTGTLPTASIIGSGNHPTLTGSAVMSQAAPNGSWTSTALVANDVLGFKLTTAPATSTTGCTVGLKLTKTSY
jgi:hypothetical protein